ncbi:hypothetical protein [Burkholderia anthina]|uniref:hypothetical protein n=1 Tax=Burkholderia anthina TaxID=179879 RepID=UPI00158DDCD9
MDRDECARGDGVVTADGTPGQDGVDRQMQARTLPAVMVVGGCARDAHVARIASSPPHQRATDSHDSLDRVVESIEHLATRGRLPVTLRSSRVPGDGRSKTKAGCKAKSPESDVPVNHQGNRCKDVSGFSLVSRLLMRTIGARDAEGFPEAGRIESDENIRRVVAGDEPGSECVRF